MVAQLKDRVASACSRGHSAAGHAPSVDAARATRDELADALHGLVGHSGTDALLLPSTPDVAPTVGDLAEFPEELAAGLDVLNVPATLAGSS